MQNWKIKKRLYEETWDLKDMKFRLQLLREFIEDKYYIDNAVEGINGALSNIELSMSSDQLKRVYTPPSKNNEKEN